MPWPCRHLHCDQRSVVLTLLPPPVLLLLPCSAPSRPPLGSRPAALCMKLSGGALRMRKKVGREGPLPLAVIHASSGSTGTAEWLHFVERRAWVRHLQILGR